jgi:cell division septum initiation protein DivIVA
MKPTALVLLALVVLNGCASKSGSGDSSTIGKGIDVETMRPPEAAQVVAEFQKKYGIEPVAAPDTQVTSMAQVLEIVRGDRFSEFEAARAFTAGKQGSEALTIRSYLETSYAGGLLLAAAILEEERRQNMTELRQVSQSRPLEVNQSQAADQARAQQLKTKTEDLRKVVRALNVLSEEPLVAGADLAEQAIRQDPQSQLAYLANANYYRLRGSWLEFDRMMRYAEDTETGENPPVKTYLRAMEALQRYVDPGKCKELLEETLARRPDFVRAQANLVLVDRNIEDTYAQLQKLRQMSPNHLVVRLAGPMIEEEYATAQELKGAIQN